MGTYPGFGATQHAAQALGTVISQLQPRKASAGGQRLQSQQHNVFYICTTMRAACQLHTYVPDVPRANSLLVRSSYR